MTKLNIAISLRDDIPLDSAMFSNGLSQNIKFFYDLLETMGHKPHFLVQKPVATRRLQLNGNQYRAVTHDTILESKTPFSLIFEVGVTICQADRERLREKIGAKIISLRYGHSMLMDMEQMCHQETLPIGLYEKEPDAVWASPHFKNSYSYLATVYNAPVRECPYIWEPDFVSTPFDATDYRDKPDIYVMEPNISILKNALIPLAIIENIYRSEPNVFGKATILNGTHFQNREYFLSNIVRNFDSLISHADKVYFTGRYKFDEVFQKRDILLGHQMGCELNYLYLEALWKGVPLVHNSPAFKEAGYYYPDCEVFEGRDQCLKAIRDKAVGTRQKQNKAFIQRFSIHNKTVQQGYRELIQEALDS
ncbi:MAG: DUF2827 family protein [Porticoccaceae bacterium]